MKTIRSLLLGLDRGGSRGCSGLCILLGLDLGCQILDGLLQIDERNPTDQVALLAGRLVGKGSGVEEACLAGLGVPLNNGINLLVGDGDLRGDALEGSLLRSGLVACCKAEADNGEE